MSADGFNAGLDMGRSWYAATAAPSPADPAWPQPCSLPARAAA